MGSHFLPLFSSLSISKHVASMWVLGAWEKPLCAHYFSVPFLSQIVWLMMSFGIMVTTPCIPFPVFPLRTVSLPSQVGLHPHPLSLFSARC